MQFLARFVEFTLLLKILKEPMLKTPTRNTNVHAEGINIAICFTWHSNIAAKLYLMTSL